MRELALLTSADCGQCEHAKAVLRELAAERDLAWREVDAGSPEGLELARSAPPLRPVLFAPDGRLVAYGRLSTRRLLRELERVAVMARLPDVKDS